MSRPVVRSGSRGGPGRPPRLPAGRRGQRRAAAAARSVCGPEGKGKGRGDVEGEQVKSAGTVEAGGSEREGEGGRGEAAGPSRVSPPPGSPRPAPVLFAPEAAAAEGLSGGWGGDTGGAGGRAGARPHRSGPGQRSWRGGTAARAVYLAAPVVARPPGKRVPGGSFRRRRACSPPPGRARQVVLRRSFILTLRRPSAAAASWSPRGAGLRSQSVFAAKQQQQKNLGALGSAPVQCLLPGPPPAVLALRAPPGECRGRPARLGTDSASAALRAAAGPTQGSSGTFSLCQQRTGR